MIFDNTLLLSDAQAITGDAASTNVIDLGATGTPYGASSVIVRDIGKGECKVPLYVLVTEAFNNLTSLTVQLQTDDNSSFSSAKTLAQTTIVLASLTAGYKFEWPAMFPEGTNERYTRLYYDVTGTNPSTGKITAGVVAARQSNFVGGA